MSGVMAGRFAGKTIIVTGSGREKGLGQAILQRFADEGANCIVSDLGKPAEHMGAGDIGTTDEMEGVAEVRPNTATHPQFAEALAQARTAGVKVLFLLCRVEPDGLAITQAREWKN